MILLLLLLLTTIIIIVFMSWANRTIRQKHGLALCAFFRTLKCLTAFQHHSLIYPALYSPFRIGLLCCLKMRQVRNQYSHLIVLFKHVTKPNHLPYFQQKCVKCNKHWDIGEQEYDNEGRDESFRLGVAIGALQQSIRS